MRCERGNSVVTAFPVFNCLRNLGEGGVRRSMLPGFRFLLAAIILSTSMLVFGLGAAALLRAAHEQFASNPSWHAAPEATFAQQQAEPVPPVLAMLHAEPAPVEVKAPDNVAPPVEQATNVATPAEQTAVSPAAPEQASVTQTSIPQTSVNPATSEPERVAALKPEQTPAPESATPAKSMVAADPAASLSAPVQNETSATDAGGSSSSSSPSDSTVAPTKQAAIAPQANDTASNEIAAAETASTNSAEDTNGATSQSDAVASPDADAISTKLAALDGRPLIVQPRPRPTAAIARAEQAAKKRLARQAALRRKLAAQAQQAALFPPLFPPFPQQLNQPPGVATNH